MNIVVCTRSTLSFLNQIYKKNDYYIYDPYFDIRKDYAFPFKRILCCQIQRKLEIGTLGVYTIIVDGFIVDW